MAAFKQKACEIATGNEPPRTSVYRVLSLALYFLKKLPNAISLDHTRRNGFLFILIFILNLRKQGELKYKTTDFTKKGRIMSGHLAIHCSDVYFSCTLKPFFI